MTDIQKEIDHIKELLEIKQQRRYRLEKQVASFGKLNVPPHIILELEDTLTEIEDLEKKLTTLKSSHSRHPTPPPPETGELIDDQSRNKLDSFRQVKIRNLEKRLTNLFADYEAANNQLSNSLSDVDQIRLKRQIEMLEQEINQVQSELNSLQ